jgi:uncharacterized protein involved in tolerance to divalent cations
MPDSELIVIMTTFPDLNLANNIAKILVEEKLAACVHVMPSMTSTYIWEGKLCQESEHLVLIKTIASNYESLAARLSSLHLMKYQKLSPYQRSQLSKIIYSGQNLFCSKQKAIAKKCDGDSLAFFTQ